MKAILQIAIGPQEGGMIKDILVHLDGSADDELRLQHAEAIATASQGHLTGLFTNPLADLAAFMPLDAERLHSR